MSFDTILEAVRSLPTKEQERLVTLIQGELQTCPDPDFPPEAVEEIKRRAAEYDADPSIGIPWETVEANVDALLEELGE